MEALPVHRIVTRELHEAADHTLAMIGKEKPDEFSIGDGFTVGVEPYAMNSINWMLFHDGEGVGEGHMFHGWDKGLLGVRNANIDAEYRGQGLYGRVLKAISGYYGLAVRSDIQLTQSAKKAWEKLGAEWDGVAYRLHAESLLTEASGTLSWYHPATGEEVYPDHLEHAESVEQDPEVFGLSQDDIDEWREAEIGPEGYFGALINMVLKKGWVRVNFYKGEISVHALKLQSARKAAYRYVVEEDWPTDGAVVDLPDKSFELKSRDEVWDWVRKGKLPINIARHLREAEEEEEEVSLGQQIERIYKLELEHAKLKARPDAGVRQDVQGRIQRLETEITPVIKSIAFELSLVFDSYVFDLENEFPDIFDIDPEDMENEQDASTYEEVQMLLDKIKPIAEELNAMGSGRWAPPFGQMMVTIHKALTTAHHSGEMLDHVQEEHPDVTKELLDRLSAGELK